MARGGDDSDEERHDRFRSERNTSSGPRPLFSSLNSSKRTTLSSDDRRSDRRRSERDRSQSRRSRERSWDRRREREESVSHARGREESVSQSRRRSGSGDRDDKKRKRHKERRRRSSSNDRSKQSRRNRSSSERRSDSRSSHDSRSDRRHSKRPRRSRDRDYEQSSERVDTFMQRFERRRDSSIEEEIVDNHILVYCEGSTSPDRSKHKKRKNGEKLRKKEKRKEKKEKRKEKKKGSMDISDDKLVVSDDDSPDKIDLTEDDVLQKEPSPLCDSYGPKIPPKVEEKLVGPVVPSSSPEETLPGNRSTDSSQKDIYGPVAPPTLENLAGGQGDTSGDADAVTPDHGKAEDRIYGPALPHREAVVEVAEDCASYGPALPPSLKKPKAEVESDDDGSYGPLPAGLGGRTQEELEMRAALIRRQLENQDIDSSGPKKREEWMIELPNVKRAQLGLGPRKFRAREGPDMSDRSSWTETPEEKRKKEELARLGVDLTTDDDDNTNSQRIGIIERDKEMEKKARQGKKKDKSLLEIHQKELKKKKKKEHKERGEKKEERRPFNRETDLQTNRFDEAQKRSIIKKAQLLDSRFSRGESKYL